MMSRDACTVARAGLLCEAHANEDKTVRQVCQMWLCMNAQSSHYLTGKAHTINDMSCEFTFTLADCHDAWHGESMCSLY